MAGNVFKFKEFNVDQSGCAMKINTDGVLLGALAEAGNSKRILDIGTGTGVIALMLAQRYVEAYIDAVEIDEQAAHTAARNCQSSPFAIRMNAFQGDFATIVLPYKYDLIVSNPPFFVDSLTSASEKKNLARHTDETFFERLVAYVTAHLTDTGTCKLILPLPTAGLIKQLLPNYELYMQGIIAIKSFTDSEPHRQILTFGKKHKDIPEKEFVIYDAQNVYSKEYHAALREFLTIF